MKTAEKTIGVKVRTVNEMANQIQLKGGYPVLARDLHEDVLLAVKLKQDVVLLDYDRWQKVKIAASK